MENFTAIQVDVKLEFKDYLKAVFVNAYLVNKVVWGILLLAFVGIAAQGEFLWAGLFLMLFSLIFPINIWVSAKRHWNSNNSIKQDLHYIFSKENIQVHGATFNATNNWVNVYAAREFKNYFVISPSRGIIWLIPKKFFLSPDQLQSLKNLLREVLGAKARLGN